MRGFFLLCKGLSNTVAGKKKKKKSKNSSRGKKKSKNSSRGKKHTQSCTTCRFFTQVASEALQIELHIWQFPIDISPHHFFFPEAQIFKLMIRATAATNSLMGPMQHQRKGLSGRQTRPQSHSTGSPGGLQTFIREYPKSNLAWPDRFSNSKATR